MRAALGVAAAIWVAALLVLCTPPPVHAAPVEVNVRIEGRTHTLFEGPILTEGHAVSSYKADGNGAQDLAEHPCDGINALDPQNTSPGPTPTAASVDAMNVIGETPAMAGQWYPGFNDYFVKQWGAEAENAEADGESWGILVNNVFTSVGGCQYQLDEGDDALWAYNAFEFRPFLALFAANAHYAGGARPLTATAQLGVPFQVEVLTYEDDTENVPPQHPERAGAEPFPGAKVAPVLTSEQGFETVELESLTTATTDVEGKASITFAEPGWHRIKAGAPLNPSEEEAIRSNRLDVCVPAPGASGCGAVPPEDEVRVPARYRRPPGEEVPAPQEQAGGGSTTVGEQPTSGMPGATTAGISRTLAASAHHVAKAKVAVASIGVRQLVLRISQAGLVTVKIARQVRSPRRHSWRTVATLKAKARKAGTLRIALPRLDPGSYRASITLAGAGSLTKTFLVHRVR
jgi:hypothetical protein